MRREEQAKARKVGGSPILHKLKGRVKGHGACLFYPKRNGEPLESVQQRGGNDLVSKMNAQAIFL